MRTPAQLQMTRNDRLNAVLESLRKPGVGYVTVNTNIDKVYKHYRHLNNSFNPEGNYLLIDDEGYPGSLKSRLGNRAPSVLFVRGNPELINKKVVGFCGSRHATEKGISISNDIVAELVKNDIVICSGYATGVDTAAHKMTLDSGGSTVIVLPNGFDAFKIKKELSDSWDWDRILIISEFENNIGWSVARAMLRNNTIVGLSDAMVLVEARDKGGSYEAGLTSIKLSVPLFVVYHSTQHELTLGNIELKRKGALSIGKDPITGLPNVQKILNVI